MTAALPSAIDLAGLAARHLAYTPGQPLLFSSGTFWVMFMLFIPVYAMLRGRLWQMLVFVTAFSLYFYYRCSGAFVALLLATSWVDWGLSRLMARLKGRAARRACVAVSLGCSLGVLAWFKYADFFLWNINALVGSNFQPLELMLPVGISFYTFQSVSYIIDVYKGRVAPTATWLEYAFFLSFFPALVAGPIVRADYFLPQIRRCRHATLRETRLGLWLILAGVLKKAVVADYLAQYNDLIFDAPGAYSGFETFMGIIGYTMQIYCDFSGYSDMAIGLAMIMGFALAPNFNFPYKARNLSDFWRRWHISLSTWLRDYVYIPLGGNRRGTARTYLNNFATMLIGGLWHGAAWRFVMWGAMHGAGLAVHKAVGPRIPARVASSAAWRAGSWIVTMSFVAALWVFFRASSASDAMTLLRHAVADFDPAMALPFAAARTLWLIMLVAIVAAHALPARWWRRASMAFVRAPWVVRLILFLVVVQLTVELRSADVVPFIYFRF